MKQEQTIDDPTGDFVQETAGLSLVAGPVAL
jgi:hypothetical protein